MTVLVFLVCFGASIIGAICGIGGGVIIKPALDAFGIMDVATISFLSGCTVLSMTTYNVVRSKLSGDSKIDSNIGLPMALGAAIGGVFGKQLFQIIRDSAADPEFVGAVQAICLIAVTLGTLLYTLYKHRIKTHEINSRLLALVIGLLLGVMSSFLGIGGGPINLVVLYYFFSMDSKTAAENSLYVIFFSQTASLIASIVTKTVPSFEIGMLLLMACGGICGGMVGRKINKKIDNATVDKLFIGLMVVMIVVNIFNVFKFI
ncbi:MAG: sulfite exporter TauE/SafE family protein [Oscillospiraceae bacterium]|nr:sulfite exporter TauE/SafE family protein [Oscillospiraceae bacterium]